MEKIIYKTDVTYNKVATDIKTCIISCIIGANAKNTVLVFNEVC